MPSPSPTSRAPKTALMIFLALVIGGGIAVRLIGITQPFVDLCSWREADVAMIAENFFHGGYDILHPRINWSADTTGVVGTEFPLVPAAAAVLYRPFGVQEWIGRVIPLLFFAVSIPFFYLLLRRIVSAEAAAAGLAAYCFAPLGIMMSRSFMPDAPALACSVIGLYCFMLWSESGRNADLMRSAAMVSLAILVKAPYAIVLAPIAYVAVRKLGLMQVARSKALWGFTLVVLIPPAAWYMHALLIPTATPVLGGEVHFFGEQGVGFASWDNLSRIAVRNFSRYLTPWLAVPALAGLFLPPKTAPYRWLFHWWLLAALAFVLVDGPGNAEHAWYQLPFVAIFAGLAASALDFSARRYALPAGLVLVCGLSWFSYRVLHTDYRLSAPGCVPAGKTVDAVAPAGALALIADGGDPTCLYYTRRKGWHFWNPHDDEEAIQSLEHYRALGAGYLMVDNNHMWWLNRYRGFAEYLNAKYKKVADAGNYVIYELTRFSPP